MSIELLPCTDGRAALIDTITGLAFGPIFENPTIASAFLDWALTKHDRSTLPHLKDAELIALRDKFIDLYKCSTCSNICFDSRELENHICFNCQHDIETKCRRNWHVKLKQTSDCKILDIALIEDNKVVMTVIGRIKNESIGSTGIRNITL